MTEHLKRLGYRVNRKRIRRLMRLMGIEAIYQTQTLSHQQRASDLPIPTTGL